MICRESLLRLFDNIPTIDGLGLEPVIALRDVKEIIKAVPEVDAVPVVHSRWIEPVPGDGFPYCGNCKAYALDKGLFLNPKLMDWHKTKYCPNCGAKMDLEKQNEG